MRGQEDINTQILDESLFVDKIIYLKVGKNPKKDNKPAFLPQFVDDDPILINNNSVLKTDSFRIFIPNNTVELVRGEIWKVKITGIKVSQKRTKDGRHYIYINVDVLSRDETIEKKFEYSEGVLIIQKKSGHRVLAEKKFPYQTSEHWHSQNGYAVRVLLYYVEGKIIKTEVVEKFSRSEFANHIRRTIRNVNPMSIFKKLEPLPKIVIFEEFF
jgi:hypothetical protein